MFVGHFAVAFAPQKVGQLAPGVDARVGLGLCTSPAATVAVEAAMIAVGVLLLWIAWFDRHREPWPA